MKQENSNDQTTDQVDVGTYLDAQWGSCWCVPLHNTPLFVNQELGEVPFYVLTKETTFAGLQELVDGCSIVAIDINLTK